MEKTTVSKKGAVILGGMPMIASVGLKDDPNLWVIAALTLVLTVYLCVQGYLDWLEKSKDVPGV